MRDLQLIVEVNNPIRIYLKGKKYETFVTQVFYSSMIPLLDTKAITVVFANVEDILLTNTVRHSLLSTLSPASLTMALDFLQLLGRATKRLSVIYRSNW